MAEREVHPLPNPFEVTSGRAQLAGYRWGGTGTSLVLLHPGVGDSRIWQWCAPVWAHAGFDVVAFDRRGFGSTRYGHELHDDVTDLGAVVDAEATGRAVVVGNSRGGRLAVQYALAYPGSVAALVLIAPSVSGYDYSDWPTSPTEAGLDAQIAAAEDAGDIDEVNRLEVHYWLDGVDQLAGRVTGTARTLMSEMNAQALRAPTPGPTREHRPIWERLDAIGCPVLVVVGEHDLPGIMRQCKQLADRLPDAEHVVLRGAAHCPSLDQPEALSATVLDFVDRRVD